MEPETPEESEATPHDSAEVMPDVSPASVMKCVKAEEGYKPCGAKTRGGTPCQKPPLAGRTRCKLHGGATPRGKDSPHFKTGLYQRYLPKNLKGTFEKLIRDPELLEGRAEVALMQMRLSHLSARVQCNESGRAWRQLQALFVRFKQANDEENQEGMLSALNEMSTLVDGEVNDENAWAELTEFVEKATKIAEREWKRVIANRAVVTAEQLRTVVASITGVVLLHVKDTTTRRAIAEHIQRLRVIDVEPVNDVPDEHPAEPT